MLGVAISLGLAGGLEAELIEVDQVTDVVEKASNDGGESRTYETSNLTYSGEVPDKKIILFTYRDNNIGRAIGGLENNIDNPRIPNNRGKGFINKDDDTYWGLDFGQTLADVNGGFWAGVDLNGDGNIGTYNTCTGNISFDTGEYMAPYKVQFTGFQQFPSSGTATIDSVNIAPENSCIRNINFEVYPVNPEQGTEWKTSFVEFDFIGNNIFTQSSNGRWKLDANYNISFLINDGDGDTSNDQVVGDVDNHVVYSFDNEDDLEHYIIDDSSMFNGDYKIHGFMFGGPDFSLTGYEPDIFDLYAKIENLKTGDLEYIQFDPSYSENIGVYKTPEPATFGLLGVGALTSLFLTRERRKHLNQYRLDKKSA
jgi:hypothetical protein